MSNSKQPTLRAYAILGTNDKSVWREIGALWPHKDGKGFNLKLDLVPTGGQEIVLREDTPKED